MLPFSVFTTCFVCAQTPETGKSESARVRKFVSAPRNKKQTEETTKVIAAVWALEFIQFHAALQILDLAPGLIVERTIGRMDA